MFELKESRLRILYVGMRWDYGEPKRGLSFEEVNFRPMLEAMGNEVLHYDFMEGARRLGKRRMRSELGRVASEFAPDLVFFFLFADEVDPDTIQQVGKESGALTLNWFADDHWRFENFTRRFAPVLDWSVTTDEDSLEKYEGLGLENVILSQWGCNPLAYAPPGAGIRHEVAFVGQPHGGRRKQIKALRRAGHDVECWGHGWPDGRLSQAEMVEVFGTSAINLNLSSASSDGNTGGVLRAAARLPGMAVAGRYFSPGSNPTHTAQIKGRTFEIPGCGGFQLAEYAPHIEKYFDPGNEIALFETEEEMSEQVDYWLSNPERRQEVAIAGYRRVLKEHTYDRRFLEIFRRIGLVT